MAYRYYTPGEIEQIIEMLKEGYTITKIAKVLDREVTRLSRKIKELNLKVYKPRAEYIKKEKNSIVISKPKRADKPKRAELIEIHNEKLKKVFENTF